MVKLLLSTIGAFVYTLLLMSTPAHAETFTLTTLTPGNVYTVNTPVVADIIGLIGTTTNGNLQNTDFGYSYNIMNNSTNQVLISETCPTTSNGYIVGFGAYYSVGIEITPQTPFTFTPGVEYKINLIENCAGKTAPILNCFPLNSVCPFGGGYPNLTGNEVTQSLQIEKTTPTTNPQINQEVVYTVSYAADSFTYLYYSCDQESDGYTLYTTSAQGESSFTFSCLYEYSFADWQPAVQLRDLPIGQGGDFLIEYLSIQVEDENTDNTTFSVTPLSGPVGTTVTYTWNIDTTYHTTIDAIKIDTGLPTNIQPPFEVTAESGSTTYQYGQITQNPNIFPKLIVESNRTKEYLKSIIITNSQPPSLSLSAYTNGGGLENENGFFYFSSMLDTYQAGTEVNFVYNIPQIYDYTITSFDFYAHNLAAPVSINPTTGTYQAFSYYYTQQGIHTPKLVTSYTSSSGSLVIDTYLGGSSQLSKAKTIEITSQTVCNPDFLPTKSGVFQYCDKFYTLLPTNGILQSVSQSFTYPVIYATSYLYSKVEGIYYYKLFDALINPKAGTYVLNQSPFGISPDPSKSFIPDSVIIKPRRQTNSTNIDILLSLAITFMFVTWTVNTVIHTLKK